MVCAMLDHVCGMKKLAPTYSILSRIAMQFAGLTGVYHEREGSEGMSNQVHEQSPNSMVGHESVMSSSARTDFEEDWFASATTNLGLDFCDLNQTTSAPPIPGHQGDATYPVNIQPMISQVEDWTARKLRARRVLCSRKSIQRKSGGAETGTQTDYILRHPKTAQVHSKTNTSPDSSHQIATTGIKYWYIQIPASSASTLNQAVTKKSMTTPPRSDRLARIGSHARSRAHLPALTIFGFS
jgi:hypothetical protein